uniref:Cytochrome c oxidase subunit 3 n=1 Tax=Clavulina sp. TaxID=1745192 RepID=A0A890JIH1_9AGAM|nr:cytochrome c oxidase subunit 3 [Clavulina sp.]
MTNLVRTNYQTHPFHLVDQSPWPLLTSLALLSMVVSAVLYMHGFVSGGLLLTLGFVLTASAMTLWFRDIIAEGTYLGHHTFEVRKGSTLGVALFFVSEVFAFVSVFWAYFHSSLAPTIELGNSWPPLGITPLDPFAIPLLNTVILLSSGAFITWAHHALIQGKRTAAIWGTVYTIVLALLFTALQYVEYQQAGFTIADSVYGTVFFASTGLHGMHVIVGTLFILVGFFRLFSYHSTNNHHLGFESAILYWHFVDVVWLFLFITVYWWGS